jgi:threonine dehydrogenase-like Zn-dependent dehydrogenase
MTPGDILGHEPMGIVEAVGADITNLEIGDRVVVPFNISCGRCFMCARGLQSQCETTQVHEHGCGAALFGYTKLYGQVPGGQAELLRVPHADYGPVKVSHEAPDDRYLFLSDVLPTAWQAVQYASVPKGGSLAVLGLGPIGDMASRIARHLGVDNVIAIDLVPERLQRARDRGIEVMNIDDFDSDAALIDRIRDRTAGRGPDAVIDAVGMEAHGSPAAKMAHKMTELMPNALAARLMRKAGVDRLAALHLAIDLVRRGGTISVIGVYGGMTDPMPMMTLFDKQVQLRMGQANVRRWVDDILPLLDDGDPLGVDSFATHHLPLSEAPAAYEMFQKKHDGAVKVVFNPGGRS